SRLNVDRGNLVKDNDTTPLVVINQMRPIEVTFAVPQRLVAQIQSAQASSPLMVTVTPAKGTGAPIQGQVVFVDNQVDTTTGTLQLKAR
ncbi:HlyD family efflux transporter periplasmic adaptor subunit, partial [Haemophilus parainfluenzae]|uniref:HlyD family efflux transporter periplasmic adaptor subunit n=1 Tax=Haemophilus parainfluenzae TaxID=729 RepID=UPI00124B1A79